MPGRVNIPYKLGTFDVMRYLSVLTALRLSFGQRFRLTLLIYTVKSISKTCKDTPNLEDGIPPSGVAQLISDGRCQLRPGQTHGVDSPATYHGAPMYRKVSQTSKHKKMTIGHITNRTMKILAYPYFTESHSATIYPALPP